MEVAIPRLNVEDDLASGRLEWVKADWSSNETSVYAVYPSRRFVISKVRAFLDFVVQELSPRPSQRTRV
ncbi:MAG: LysR substrate-binding domain-containing protein [Myxococcota bacterium]